MLGYTGVLLLLVLDLGRPDRFYHFILYWNFHSPLFEISWCVLLYTTVLVLEVSPDVLRRLPWRWPLTVGREDHAAGHHHRCDALHACTSRPWARFTWPCPIGWTHAGTRELLPVLFFVSSVMAGLSLATIAYRVACRVQGFPVRSSVVTGLLNGAQWWRPCSTRLLKFGELLWAGEWPLLFHS